VDNVKNFLKENWLLIIALLYLIWPIDAIADVIPVAGQTDDAILFLIEMIRRWYIKKQTN